MKLPLTTPRTWVVLLSLLVAGFDFRAPLAAGQPPAFPPQSHLTADVSSRLTQAAQDSTLEPWQREFMLGVARQGVEGAATPPSPELPSVVLRSDGVTTIDGAWTMVPPPPVRYGHSAIYDPVRDRMVVFGGLGVSGYRNDVWALSLAGTPTWSLLTPSGSPPSARYSHTAIYDPVRDRMLVFGGLDGSAYRNDVWALSLGASPAWSAVTPSGGPPAGRYWHSAIYDPVRDRMVVFGGYDGIGYRNDVWALSLAGSPAWSALAPTGSPPSARYGHTAIYDPVRDRMVMFGGDDDIDFQNDVWALSLAGSPAWSALTPAGTPPSARALHTAIYDPVRDRMVVFGGADPSYRNDVWALSLAGSPAWSQLSPAGTPPPASYLPTMIYDPIRDRLVVCGGNGPSGPLNDTWGLSLSGSPAWSGLTPGALPPSGRYLQSAFYDPVRDRMVVFGGWDGAYRNDVWALSLAGSPAWTAITPTGTPPSARWGHTANYDPVRDRMVVCGGYDGAYRNDAWALSLAGSPAWSALTPLGSPPSARYGHTAIYDPVRDRLVVCGGYDGTYRNDVWALSFAGSPGWSALTPSGSPPSGRYSHTSIYDPVRDRMLVFGGYDPIYRNDTWALPLAGSPVWSALAPVGGPPAGRYRHTAIYDPGRDRMVVFGGYDGVIFRNDVWALSLVATPFWRALGSTGSPPSPRHGHTAIYDPVRDRMVGFGGFDGYHRNDAWALVWGMPVSVPGNADALHSRFELAPPRPNPSRGETFVDFELAEPARVVLDVFDAQGRRVKRIADDWFTAGRHVSTWRGDGDRGPAVGSGVYFIRMQLGGHHATRRMIRVR